MANKFKIGAFDNSDKSIMITGPDGLVIEVDYDDVDHAEVNKAVKRMVDVLNLSY